MGKVARFVKHRPVVDNKTGELVKEPEMKRLKELFSDMSLEEKEKTERYLFDEESQEEG